MTLKALAIELVNLAFLGLTLWAIQVHGYLGFFEVVLSTPAGIVAFTDLVIALTLAMLWMQADARERGLPLLPYIALTLALGSVGPLSYLVHREVRARYPQRVAA
jgi:TRAP-type uncharacterized transport system fused permease subunit